MGRLRGAYDDIENERQDLNKCPDCECFFAQDTCPMCGKVCPEEMRAGNRRPIKIPKKKFSGSSDRVTFVQWYHSWWFIIIMLIIMPIVGIILLATSPHKRSVKIGVIAVAVAWGIVSWFGIDNIVGCVSGVFNDPVDTSLSREEYVSACETVSPETFYRYTQEYNGKFISTTVEITEKFTDVYSYYSSEKYTAYYVGRSPDGSEFQIIIRNCLQGSLQNLVVGDIVTVYGEGAGNVSLADMEGTLYEGPCINIAYADIKQ